MNRESQTIVRRLSLAVCAIAAVWTTVLARTGGFFLELGTFHFASRTPRNPALVAALSGLAAWALSSPGRRLRGLAEDCVVLLRGIDRRLRSAERFAPTGAPLLAAVLALSVVAAGLSRGAFIAGGSDSYGYVSEAHLWATGTLQVDQPFMREMRSIPPAALAPLGYRPAPSGPFIVPTYPPGFPMVMAVFERVGGPAAVFYVVPLLGGLAVWATYVMGVHLGGLWVGLSAALLLASSPSLLFQVMSPMSDVPAAAWWALTLALMTVERRGAALIGGLAACVAILTRPNLAPIAAVPAAWLLHRSMRSMSGTALQRALLYCAGVVSACVVVAMLNARWYGAPLSSGYGSLGILYGWENVGPNLTRYPRWLVAAHTPVVLFAFASPFFFSRSNRAAESTRGALAITWFVFVAAVFACYFFYQPFDAWWYLRFLLPAFPGLFVLTSVGLAAIATRLGPIGPRAAALLVILVAFRNIGYSADHTAFDFREGERKYVMVADYIAKRMPERAAFISVQHSGSIRYYSGRLTVRYDYLAPSGLDEAVEELRRLDYHPYILLEKSEEDDFRERFTGHSVLAPLNWSPVAELRQSSRVRIYDAVDQQTVSSGRPPEVID